VLAHERRRLAVCALESLHPVTQGEDVVLAKILHVACLEPRRLGHAEQRAERNQLAIGKDVPLDERVAPPETSRDPSPDPRLFLRSSAH